MSRPRTYADKTLGDTEYLLEQWGLWRMDGMGVPACVSPAAALMTQAMPMSSPKAYRITDEVAVAIDRILARLMVRAPRAGDFVWFYFGAKWPAHRIACQYSIGEAKVREELKLAVGWIDSALEHLRESA
ncbi:TPA: antiterminator Q family protein [Pseudomonas aeruginosa]|uniref:antiterminator Q family protein n=1 Tax=Pseudomonas aeruginosa TaxID=287 RepID=UPI00053DB611|nr:antiterminator Q family protein [Pseudomonas aeruginosa]MCV0233888.1 antitermination protein Q [Pseudomonas aeruginosa]MDY1056643.1 antiterminator Q family protein [Pseudomonas aeruginosa]HBO1241528.1 antitermination protein Q [Pseudomonas aeruginosa]HBO1880905.1 antitermination protein Q [Pseudomonas aeruginosa]HBO2083895.1 antitermination protein Q [Pseudomonas aeruginosa]